MRCNLMKRNELLHSIWDHVNEEKIYASQEERKATDKLIKKESDLMQLLNEDQIKAFQDYQDACNELALISQREDFINGLKFGTKYIIDIMNK